MLQTTPSYRHARRIVPTSRLHASALFALHMTTVFMFLLFAVASAHAAPPQLAHVLPGATVSLPHDFGAHPDYRTEWWYATGWLNDANGQEIGFQLTFFRTATDHDRANPSQFAPHQLIIGHAAIADPKNGKLIHAEKSARAGFDIAYAREGNTDIGLENWSLSRGADGIYTATIEDNAFSLSVRMTPTQSPMLQGENGYSRKGPRPEQASYYYSEPHLQVQATLKHDGKTTALTGSAWLDHEWSTSVLDDRAAGWEWVGLNLDDGSALVAFRIRGKDGSTLWTHAAHRERNGTQHTFRPEEVQFIAQRFWRSPRTQANYPVALTLQINDQQWQIEPMMDDQELDSRASTGAVYWEGAVRVRRDGKPVGRGYLEMTGYVAAMRL